MRKSILALAEDQTVCDQVESALSEKQLGWSVHHETSPNQFYPKVKKILPDAVLLSNFDQRNDYSFLKRLRQDKRLKNTPVILLADPDDKLDKSLLSSLKVRTVIKKPFKSEALQAVVSKILRFSPNQTARQQNKRSKPPSNNSGQKRQMASVEGEPPIELNPPDIGMVEVELPPVKISVAVKSASQKADPASKSVRANPLKKRTKGIGKFASRNNQRKQTTQLPRKKYSDQYKSPSGIFGTNGRNGHRKSIGLDKRMMAARYTEFRRTILPEGSILFTSANLNDGVSLIATEHAISQAISPNRTKPILFLDLNSFRSNGSSDLLEKYPGDVFPGIANVLEGNVKLDDCIFATKIPHLYVLPFGYYDSDFDPVSHLSSLKKIINEDLKNYRILVDSCNMMAKNRYNFDPVELAQMIDHLIFIVMSGVTTKDEFLQCKIDLETYGQSIDGVIVNDFHAVSFLEEIRIYLNVSRKVIFGFIRETARSNLNKSLQWIAQRLKRLMVKTGDKI